MTFKREFICLSLCFASVACGDIIEEQKSCTEDQPCLGAGEEFGSPPKVCDFWVDRDDTFPRGARQRVKEEVEAEDSDLERLPGGHPDGLPFRREHDVFPDVRPEHRMDTRRREERPGRVAQCNDVAEEVIEACLSWKRSRRDCDLRGSWVFSGCIAELSEIPAAQDPGMRFEWDSH